MDPDFGFLDPVVAENLPPQSYLFFIVAKVGPSESHRPVAVALCQGGLGSQFGIGGHQVIRYCLQTINVLSDHGNRIAIRTELDLATDFYKNDTDEVLLPRVRLPELDRWTSSPERDAKRYRRWDSSISPFPFIATCLQVGIGRNPMDGSEDAVRKESLGTFYYNNTLEYGMVVIDVSDLDEIRYGIIGLSTRIAQQALGSTEQQDPPQFMEEDVRRRPLSAIELMSRFYSESSRNPYPFSDIVTMLQEYPLIAVSAMNFIWPSSDDEDTILAAQAPRPVIGDIKSTRDELISSLMTTIFEAQSFDVSFIDELQHLPDFQVTFGRYLREHLERNEFLQPKVLGQLLGIAFNEHRHLDWVLLKGLSTDAIATALEMPELKEANSISLCIDTIRGTHKQLLESLCLSTSLCEMYLFQDPTRKCDDISAELYMELSSTSYLRLRRCKILLSGPFSSSLSKKFWLPTIDYKLNMGIFPVQHMFVRRQVTGTGPENPIFSPDHFYFGDAMLKPERFAAGFLQHLQSLITGETIMERQLYSFACAPSTLTDMSIKEISSIPVENFAIPVRPVKRDAERRFVAGLPAAQDSEALLPPCWPKVRDLVAGSWVVLVSKNQYRDLEGALALDQNIFPFPSFQAKFIRYAFVRLKTQVLVENFTENLGPETMEVGGLKEFIRATAPEVDQNLVDQRLKELELYISTAPDQVALGQGLKWLSVLEPHEADVMLKDFLEDAAYVKENLRLAMEDDPEGRNWYPELLQSGERENADRSDRAKREHARNTKVFTVPA